MPAAEKQNVTGAAGVPVTADLRSTPACLSGPLAFRQEAVLGRAVKRLPLFPHCLAFAGVSLAFLHEAGFGRAVERLAVAAHRAAFAGLRQSGADRQRAN